MSAVTTLSSAPTPGLVPGRTCGTCAMCCKVFAIPELDKGVQQWCRHVVQGQGCGIHPTRPETCRRFFCHWLRNPHLGPEWQPNRARFLIYTEAGGRRMVVAPDAGAPTAWRREPYYAQFKRWAAAGASSNHQILVFNGKRATAVLPDRDQDLGVVEVGDEVIYRLDGRRIEVDHRRSGDGRP
jgi:hypothetical protein